MSDDSYQERFLQPEDDRLFGALDLADKVNADLRTMGPLGLYLTETRAAAMVAFQALEVCDPKDFEAVVKCQADIRAYRRVREWISGKLQDGDVAYRESEPNANADDWVPELEGFIEIRD